MLPPELPNPMPPSDPIACHVEGSPTSAIPEPEARRHSSGTVLVALRVPSFRLLFVGQLISSVGDVFYEVALPWFILSHGGTAQDLGIVLGAYGLPRIGTAFLGGWLADRLQPRLVMLIADGARAVLVGMLASLALGGQVVVWQLVIVAAPLGTFAGLFAPAYLALTPRLLPEDHLQSGNSLNSVSLQLATLVSPGIAGILVTHLGSASALIIDAFSFLVSAASLALMQGSQSASHRQRLSLTNDEAGSLEPAQTHAATETVSSPSSFWYFLRTSRFLQAMLLFPLLGNLTGGALEVALPVFVKGPLEGSATAYGVLLVGSGIGALLGALAAGSLSRVPARGKTMLGCFFVQEILLALVPLGGSHGGIGAVAALEFGAGFCNALGNTFFLTILQQGTPRMLLGRVMGALLFTNYAFYPVSVILGGVVVTHVGPVVLFPSAALLVLLAIVVGWSMPAIRTD